MVVVPYVVLVLLHVIMSARISIPIIWPDSYAYLFSAQFIAGKGLPTCVPISELVGSVGYPVLLAPVYKLFSDPLLVFKGALFLNILFGSLFYVAIFHFLRNIFETEPKRAFTISAIISLYPSYFLQQFYTYTDSISVALIIFCVTFFYNYLKRKDLLSVLPFIVSSSLLVFINFRFVPFILVALVLISIMAFKKQLPGFHSALIIVLLTLSAVGCFVWGIQLSAIVTGNDGSRDFLIVRITSIFEILTILAVLSLIVVNIINKRYLYALSILAGFIAGFARVGYLAFFIPAIIFVVGISLLMSVRKISSKKVLISIALFIAVFFTGFFVIGINSGMGMYWDYIYNWFINFIGTTFYQNFASYGLFIVGLLFTVKIIYDESSKMYPAITYTEIFSEFYEKKLRVTDIFLHERSVALTYLILGSIFALVISIFPVRYMSTHFRADELFFGRFIEIISAAYFAIAMHKAQDSYTSDYLAFSIVAFFLLVGQAFILVLVYGNFIYSELAFQSVFSFFPLRAALGNINIGIFAIFAGIFMILTLFLMRFYRRASNLLLVALFGGFTLFGYNYVVRYFQIEKKTNTILAEILKRKLTNVDEVQYDSLLSNEIVGQNILRYAFLLPKIKFEKVNTRAQKFTSNFVMASSNILETYPQAKFIAKEYNGNGELWVLEPDFISNSDIFPSYYNLPLLEKWVAGIERYGIGEFGIMDKFSGIKIPVQKLYSSSYLEIKLDLSGTNLSEAVITVNGHKYFDQNLAPGTNQIKIKLDSINLNTALDIKFSVDYDSSTSEPDFNYGVRLASIYLKNDNPVTKEKVNAGIKPYYKYAYTLQPRANIDIKKINITAGDTIILPLTLTNTGSSDILIDGKNQIVIKWKSFLFRTVEEISKVRNYDGVSVPGGSSIDVVSAIIVPKKPGKYFLSTVLENNDGKDCVNTALFDREFLITVH